MSRKGQKYPPEPLATAEVQKLLGGCSPHCPTGQRNRALIVTLWRGGLRISEAIALEPRDLNGESIRIRRGKGGKSRVVALDPQAWAVLACWMATRDKLGIKGKVFTTLQGGALDASYVRRLLPRLAAKTGVEKRVHPHGLRHTFAYQAVEEGIDVNTIRQALGHSSLATTQVYVDHLNPRDLIKQLASRVW